VSKLLTEERQSGRRQQDIAGAIQAKQWEKAGGLLDQQLAEKPGDVETLRRKFDVLAVHKQDPAAALAVGDKLAGALRDDAAGLNNLAWALLTEAKYGQRFNELALRLARRSNELSNHAQWAYLDTLALAEFETGNVRKAIELEEKALGLAKVRATGAETADMQKALERFRAAHPDDEAVLAQPE
jgi:tetratricopeptide (TPR) repeat protein